MNYVDTGKTAVFDYKTVGIITAFHYGLLEVKKPALLYVKSSGGKQTIELRNDPFALVAVHKSNVTHYGCECRVWVYPHVKLFLNRLW